MILLLLFSTAFAAYNPECTLKFINGYIPRARILSYDTDHTWFLENLLTHQYLPSGPILGSTLIGNKMNVTHFTNEIGQDCLRFTYEYSNLPYQVKSGSAAFTPLKPVSNIPGRRYFDACIHQFWDQDICRWFYSFNVPRNAELTRPLQPDGCVGLCCGVNCVGLCDHHEFFETAQLMSNCLQLYRGPENRMQACGLLCSDSSHGVFSGEEFENCHFSIL